MMERLRRLRADVDAWMGTLSPRERVMVSAAALAVAVFVVWLVAHQIGSGISAREARIEQKTRLLSQIGKLAEGYRRRLAERQALEARLKGAPIQLMSHISQTGATLGIQVNDLRPTDSVYNPGSRITLLSTFQMRQFNLIVDDVHKSHQSKNDAMEGKGTQTIYFPDGASKAN